MIRVRSSSERRADEGHVAAATQFGRACGSHLTLRSSAARVSFWQAPCFCVETMNGRCFTALLSLQVLSAACATTAPPARLLADAPDMIWSAGTAIMHAEQAGVAVAVATADPQSGWLAVRVEVDNQSNETLTVDPAELPQSLLKSSDIGAPGRSRSGA